MAFERKSHDEAVRAFLEGLEARERAAVDAHPATHAAAVASFPEVVKAADARLGRILAAEFGAPPRRSCRRRVKPASLEAVEVHPRPAELREVQRSSGLPVSINELRAAFEEVRKELSAVQVRMNAVSRVLMLRLGGRG